MAAVGLAQNLSALRALATEGIQRGHMALHARQVAIASGCDGRSGGANRRSLRREGAIRVAHRNCSPRGAPAPKRER